MASIGKWDKLSEVAKWKSSGTEILNFNKNKSKK